MISARIYSNDGVGVGLSGSSLEILLLEHWQVSQRLDVLHGALAGRTADRPGYTHVNRCLHQQ